MLLQYRNLFFFLQDLPPTSAEESAEQPPGRRPPRPFADTLDNALQQAWTAARDNNVLLVS